MRTPATLTTSCVFGCVAALSLITGCASQYVEPIEGARGVGTLVGLNGTYIRSIDNAVVESAKQISPENGNRVRTGAGRHRVQVVTTGKRTATWSFYFDVADGETYLIEPESPESITLRVRTQSTGREILVN